MAHVLIYTKDYCPYCHRAKALLERLEQPYDEIDLEKQPEKREEMIQKAMGRTTVPQIFIDGIHIGGCDDLFTLHAAGRLKPLLEQ